MAGAEDFEMLDDIQKQKVAEWIGEGAGLSEVQRRIKDEFGVSMTYMDVRFLVLDIGAQVKDKASAEPKPEPSTPPADTQAPLPPNDADGGETVEQDAVDDTGMNASDGSAEPQDEGFTPPGMEGGSVKVDLDRIVRAGAMASGTVTFSDGVTGSWYLDRFGRLGLTKVSKPGYQPSRADLEEFQIALQEKLAGGV